MPALLLLLVLSSMQDDLGLADFHQNYFTYPLYRDVNLDFYRALGDGKITDGMTWSGMLNPFKIYREINKMSKRLKSKGLEGNYKGEGLKTGGIIIFGKDGQPQFQYPESTGTPLNVDDLMAAVNSIRGGGAAGAGAASGDETETMTAGSNAASTVDGKSAEL